MTEMFPKDGRPRVSGPSEAFWDGKRYKTADIIDAEVIPTGSFIQRMRTPLTILAVLASAIAAGWSLTQFMPASSRPPVEVAAAPAVKEKAANSEPEPLPNPAPAATTQPDPDTAGADPRDSRAAEIEVLNRALTESKSATERERAARMAAEAEAARLASASAEAATAREAAERQSAEAAAALEGEREARRAAEAAAAAATQKADQKWVAKPAETPAAAAPAIAAQLPSSAPDTVVAEPDTAKPNDTGAAPVLVPARLKSDPDPHERAAAALAAGRKFFARGDLKKARAQFERAAALGLPEAALALGITFDPVGLAKAGLKAEGQPAKARAWYRRAHELAHGESDRRIPNQ